MAFLAASLWWSWLCDLQAFRRVGHEPSASLFNRRFSVGECSKAAEVDLSPQHRNDRAVAAVGNALYATDTGFRIAAGVLEILEILAVGSGAEVGESVIEGILLYGIILLGGGSIVKLQSL